MKAIWDCNTDERVHGILVQLPLPGHISSNKIMENISLTKDVDGLHPFNVGSLRKNASQPLFIPCTPAAVMHIIQTAKINLEGATAVIVGRSDIVVSKLIFFLTLTLFCSI